MKALIYHETGEPKSVLKLEEVPPPPLAPGGALVRVLPEWSGTDGIMHLVFASRRGMLPSVRAVIDFAAAALRSSAVS